MLSEIFSIEAISGNDMTIFLLSHQARASETKIDIFIRANIPL
jgi:hypothetical protein